MIFATMRLDKNNSLTFLCKNSFFACVIG
uniref:Uncharacterized protein n=1 Tax=Romanomermis culicivorax TaxID=13658 RepID=A0A915I0C9_ROMCU